MKMFRSLIVSPVWWVVLLALIFRLFTFDYYMPFMEPNMEGNMFLTAQGWRGFDETSLYGYSVTGTTAWLKGYPPLFIWLSMGSQVLLEQFSPKPWLLVVDYVLLMRGYAVVLGTLTTWALIEVGRLLDSPESGLLAGLTWALSPMILRYNSWATADPYVYFFVAVCVLAMLKTWHEVSWRWSAVGVVALVLAIYAKYTLAPLLLIYGAFMLLTLRKAPRQVAMWLLPHALFGLATAGYLAFGYGALGLQNAEADAFRQNGITNALTWELLSNTVIIATLSWHPLIFWVGTLLGGIALLKREEAHGIGWHVYAIVGSYLGVGMMIASSFGYALSSRDMRHVLPFMVAWLPMWSVGVVRFVRVMLPRVQPVWAVRVALLVGMPFAISTVYHFTAPHTMVQLWRYVEVILPEDETILIGGGADIQNTWNRPYSGYDGTKNYFWAPDDTPQNQTPSAFVEQGVNHYVVTDFYLAEHPEVQPFVDQLVLLKHFPEPNSYSSGSQIWFYRLLPPTHPAQIRLNNGLQVVGYELEQTVDTLTVQLFWRIEQPLNRNYNMGLYLLPLEQVEVLAQVDGTPQHPQRPTSLWHDPNELYVGQPFRLTIPNELSEAEIRLALAVYDVQTGERLSDANGTTLIDLTTVLTSSN